eukprot:c2908_g1_i1.p1 GENE.c2908_g1_i1~~c2908_g1_i1.p1  ORF type:complete len:513 (-),score=157.96 c2908_g1_i1:117-1607(-)
MSTVDIPPAVAAVVDEIRQSQTNKFVVVGYEGKSALKVLASGEGGFADVCAALLDNDFCYGFYKTTLQIDQSVTVKFVFIHWAPHPTPPFRKALLGTHVGFVTDALFQPFHADIQASDRSDLDESYIIRKLETAAGVAQNVISNSDASSRPARSFTGFGGQQQTKQATGSGMLGGATTQGAVLEVADKDDFDIAMKNLRDDAHPNDWVLLGYQSKDKLHLVGQGTGGVTALRDALEESNTNYGIFRTTEVIDQSTTVKFIFVAWHPESIPLFQRATVTTHKGVVESLFSPFHTSLRITTKSDISEEIARKILSDLSGKGESATKRIGTAPVTSAQSTTAATPRSAAPTQGAELEVIDRAGIEEAIKSVRDDTSELDWLVVGYDSNKARALKLVKSGSGGLDSLLAAFEDDAVNYALLRVTEQIDKSVTVKFVFVHFQPESVPATTKARVLTHKGNVRDLFGQWHVDFFINSREEISSALVFEKVGHASGALSHVKQ